MRAPMVELILPDVELGAPSIENDSHVLAFMAISNSYGFKRRYYCQWLAQHFAQRFHCGKSNAQPGERAWAVDHDQTVELQFGASGALQQIGNAGHQACRVSSTFEGAESEHFETRGVSATQRHTAVTTRSVDRQN